MTNPPGKNPLPSSLEHELSQFATAPPSNALDLAIRTKLAAAAPQPHAPNRAAPNYSFADRLLLFTCSAGLAAACLIITFLTLDITDASTARPGPTFANSPLAPAPDTPQRLLARLMNDLPTPNPDIRPITRPN